MPWILSVDRVQSICLVGKEDSLRRKGLLLPIGING
jgi:hypothetical protein